MFIWPLYFLGLLLVEAPLNMPEQPVETIATAPPALQHILETVPQNGTGKIAIVIDDMGLAQRYSQQVTQLPGPLTLAYLPYAQNLPQQTRTARQRGHSLMVHMPMEPLGRQNPGYNALYTNLPLQTLQQRIRWNLSRFQGFNGVNNHMGSKFTSNQAKMEVMMVHLASQNLFFLDSKTIGSTKTKAAAQKFNVPHLTRDIFIDHLDNTAAINRQLAATLKHAQRYGKVIAIGHPRPRTIAALKVWLPQVEARGYELVAVRSLLGN